MFIFDKYLYLKKDRDITKGERESERQRERERERERERVVSSHTGINKA